MDIQMDMECKGPMTREGTCQSLQSRALSLDVDLKRWLYFTLLDGPIVSIFYCNEPFNWQYWIYTDILKLHIKVCAITLVYTSSMHMIFLYDISCRIFPRYVLCIIYVQRVLGTERYSFIPTGNNLTIQRGWQSHLHYLRQTNDGQ